jgi:hypothetical protein
MVDRYRSSFTPNRHDPAGIETDAIDIKRGMTIY